eukprot:m.1053825 g.1053825  ORF g.1053825 m.1053825 type:complete len:275 (+) comp24188_c0_seq6:978-1802(+)
MPPWCSEQQRCVWNLARQHCGGRETSTLRSISMGFNTSANGKSFVIGLEYPNLLVSVLKSIAGDQPSVGADLQHRSHAWGSAFAAMKTAIEGHMRGIVGGVTTLPDHPFAFAGVDSSPAPSKAVESMCRVVELLGVSHFGASGTVECCAHLTRLFKSLCQGDSEDTIPLVGFSGLMFAALEDRGLAAAAAAGHYDIRNLLTYSAVCGIGLDTVPIPHDTTPEQIARLACDCGAMAFRLNKPLTVRLFPAPKLQAGDTTAFESDDLCNCSVFAVP